MSIFFTFLIALATIFLLIILLIVLNPANISYFSNVNSRVFKAPPSFTKLSNISAPHTSTVPNGQMTILEKYKDKLKEVVSGSKSIINDVNTVNVPTFFNANEKWPGCLPRPLFQGTCGSCWGFASVTCLSSRFYIESCGNSSCGNYPQINSGSIDDVYSNLNEMYNFNKIYLKDITEYVDLNKDGNITKDEWIRCTMSLYKKLWGLPKYSQDRYFVAQILIHILDFQSMGSLSLKDVPSIKGRANKTFDVWLKELGIEKGKDKGSLNTKRLLAYWRKQPISLSAEKLISCCIDCYKLEFNAKDNERINNPVCTGGSLQDAWVLLRDTGTTETLCIGYNLDNYKEGDYLPSCRELQGPFYSFCTGYRLDDEDITPEKINNELTTMENAGAYPVAISHESKYPWVDPQLIRFKAKNAYTVSNDSKEIQQEIMQRGPVNSGFYVYEDFQSDFGSTGKGGQLYDGKNPLGSKYNSLVYMRDTDTNSDEQPIGGHAITIVGWGTFVYKEGDEEYQIPYWTCLNSWGTEWGHNGFPNYENRNGIPSRMDGGGYFWIVRGINNCGIEENVSCGQPNVENISYPGVINKYGWGADPPSQNNENIKFLPGLNLDELDVGGKKLTISPTIEGGGGFVDFVPPNTYDLKSMEAPSPFVMFWPNDRPIFCIGLTQNKLSKTDKNVKITSTTYNFIKTIRESIYKNPLLLIGDNDNQEQVQLLALGDDNITIERGVNFNKLRDHKKNSSIKVFPYQDLSIDFLGKNGFIKCSMMT